MAGAPIPPHKRTRIAITGLGLVTPLGVGRELTWRGLIDGRSATRWLADPELAGRAGAPVPHGLPLETWDPVSAWALLAADEAALDAGDWLAAYRPARRGCVIGASKGGLVALRQAWQATHRADFFSSRELADEALARLWREGPPNGPVRGVASRFDAQGAALCPVAACATGLVAVERGASLIEQGVCDVVLAGSSDASLCPLVLASFARLGVLAPGGADPAHACRPFDARRRGFVVGEGAAILVLERLDRALERGCVPHAEWLAGRVAADPTHLTRPDPEPRALARLLTDLFAETGLRPADVDYINLHGTGTRHNDASETAAVRQVWGPAADRVACSSLKGGLGHLLGAAGSVELGATVLALRDGIIPPTVNLEHPDPRCDLDYTPRTARARELRVALKLSLGFGGHLAGALLRRWPEPRPRPAPTAGPAE